MYGKHAVFTKAEIVQASRTADWLILVLSFLVFTGGFHVHAMLTMGDWDFWTDWKDRRLWVTVTPVMCITFPAAAQYFMWGKLRLPFAATFTILGLLYGEWVNRYFNFWGWTYFPINFVWAATLVPGAIVLDTVLLWSKSYLVTAVVGGLGFGLIFYPGNWVMLAPLHQPVEYHGMAMTIADIQGYHYVRTGTPEYIRFVEKGTLRTFGKDVVPVSAFFSGFICVLIYFIWHFFGRWFCTTKYLDPEGREGLLPRRLALKPGAPSELATLIATRYWRVESIVTIFRHLRHRDRASTAAPPGPKFGRPDVWDTLSPRLTRATAAEAAGRHVNVWLEEGHLPLEVGTRYRIGVDIGSQRQDAAGGGKFQEPSWGDRQQLDLAIVLTGKGAQIEPAWHNPILPRHGNMPAVYFQVQPLVKGPLTLCLSIMLAKEMTLLEEFQITLDVVADSAEVSA